MDSASYVALIFLLLGVIGALPTTPDVIELKCNLITDEKSSTICNLRSNLTNLGLVGKRFTPVSKTTQLQQQQQPAGSVLPNVFELDGSSASLNWLNKYQPVSTRWYQLCPSSGQQQFYAATTTSYYCLNYETCDSTGVCTVKFNIDDDENKIILVHLNDNLNEAQTEAPAFPSDLQLVNLSLDLAMFDVDTELVLIESTARLNPFASKPNRLLNEFQLNAIESDKEYNELHKKHCGSQPGKAEVSENPFSVRLDSASEKLYLKFKNSNGVKDLFKKRSCFVYSLSVKRPTANGQPSLALVVINVAENKIDQPVFEFSVYNFTIVENSPFNTVIGQVRAVYSNHIGDQETVDSLIKYRIVPFLASFDSIQQQGLLDSDEMNGGTSGLPVKINPVTGWLTQKLNIDREKYLTSLGMEEDGMLMLPKFGQKFNRHQSKALDPTNDGLLRLNIESSYASISYAYCQVNIFIQDVNDNAPIARIKPLPSFGQAGQPIAAAKIAANPMTSGQTVNIFANEHTSVNQIMAYLSVHDPDAGENGTIKAIDLNLVSFKKAPEPVLKSRTDKLTILKQANVNSLPSVHGAKGFLSTLSSQVSIPFKLNKIGDKMYTIQLISKLDFGAIESYTVDMKIKDAGTRPQLESNTRIVLNVVDQNDHAPIFVHKSSAVTEIAIELAENEAVRDSVILKLNAIDLDDDKNGQVKYKIISNPYGDKNLLDTTFQLDQESGELRLLRPLNRDEIDGDVVELIVMAQDQAEPVRSRLNSTCTVRIKVVDKNNHSPTIHHYSDNSQIEIQVFMDELNQATNSTNTSVLSSGRRNALSSKRYRQISDIISLEDMDNFETNSKNFLTFMSKNQSALDQDQFTNKASFVYADDLCSKAIGLRFKPIASPVDSEDDQMDFPFLILVEEQSVQTGTVNISSVKCQMTIWVDIEKQKLINSINPELVGRDLSYEFAINAFDYGDESQFVEKSKELKVSISLLSQPKSTPRLALFGLNQDQDEEVQDKLLITANMTKMSIQNQPLSLAQFVVMVEAASQKQLVRLDSVVKLADRSDSIHSKLVQQAGNPRFKASSFKLIDLDTFKANNNSLYHRFNLVFEPSELDMLDGNYLINLAVSNSSQDPVTLKQIQLIAFNNLNNNNYSYEIKLNQLRQYYEQVDLVVNDYYKNQLNRLFSGGVETYGDRRKPAVFETQYLMQFQNLLMAGNMTSSFGGLANAPAGSSSSSFFTFLLNNRASYVQFMIVLVLVSLTVLAFVVCCIAFIIRRNCWCTGSKNKKKLPGGETSSNSGASFSGDSSTKSSLASSSLTNKLFNKSKDTATLTTLASSAKMTTKNKDFRNLNVIDDNDKLDSSDHGGFVTNSSENKTFTSSAIGCQVTDTKEKVSRYLDALDVNILTRHQTTEIHSESNEHYQRIHHHLPTGMMMCNEPTYNIIAYGENAPNTGSSSPSSTTFTNSSTDNSKKNLVIPVDKTSSDVLASTANTISSSAANGGNSNKQSSVCTLSTTSSSCVSDEGCHGSSDFSSERDSQALKLRQQQKQQQQQQQLVVNSSSANSFRNSSDQLSLYCPIQVQSPRGNESSSSAILRQKQQNYCINNLTRFERIYNNSNNAKKPGDSISIDQSPPHSGGVSFTHSLTSPPPSPASLAKPASLVKNSPFLKAEKLNTISGSYV